MLSRLPLLAALVFLPITLVAQAAPGAFKAGDRVEADYYGRNQWIPATVLEVETDGFNYKLSGDPYSNGKPMTFILHFKRVRAASAAAAPAAAKPVATPAASASPLAGKYGCTESIYHVSGYETELRGYVTLRDDGTYAYGVGKPGHYTFDAKSGMTSFTDGYLEGGTATAVDGRRDRMFLTPFTTSERKLRWTCTKIG